MLKVAIVGAGPAGIAMGVELVQSGIPIDQIIIFEKSEHDSASIRQFYPENKSINSVYKNFDLPIEGLVGFSGLISLSDYYTMVSNLLQRHPFSIMYNTEINKIMQHGNHFILEGTNEDVFESEYVVLASGVFAKPRKPSYSVPPGLRTKVSYDIVKLQKNNISGSDILVVGGGDSASEYAQFLAESGNNVILSYRQAQFVRMNQLNKDNLENLVLSKKVKIYFSTNIVAISEEGNRILVQFQENDDIVVDYIVYALGGSSPTSFMHNCGIEYDDENVVLREYNETNQNKLFMIGDLAMGRKGGSLMLAFNGARTVMQGLHKNYGFPTPSQSKENYFL